MDFLKTIKGLLNKIKVKNVTLNRKSNLMELIFSFFNYVVKSHSINIYTVTFHMFYSWSLFWGIKTL